MWWRDGRESIPELGAGEQKWKGLHVPTEITDTQPRCTRRAVVKRDASTTERDVE